MSEKLLNNYTGLEIAVVGLACKFPGAKDKDVFWQNLIDGKESIKFFSEEELKGVAKEVYQQENYVKAGGGQVQDKDFFDADFFDFTPKEALYMDRQMRLMFECAWHALEDAGYNPYNYQKSIGLYAGSSTNFELINYLKNHQQSNSSDMLSTLMGIDKDYLATNISYKLNLRGPAVNVQTACSSSLVAVHIASRALLMKECDLALAGGVSIQGLEQYGYLHQPNMIMSKDGHTRTFDKDASGTIFGDGVGLVVLKRLKDAISDNDHIYAVIKGTMINNDGSQKIGFTAPSITGQAEVIKKAYQVAKVDPETIDFIEAHGTGTNIGDPIEVEALNIAFATGKRNFSMIGSVKSNIGHLECAAGIAGFIKAVLSAKNKLLPPTINFNQPNDKISFDDSPFKVASELTDFNDRKEAIRGGISSFGIGGMQEA